MESEPEMYVSDPQYIKEGVKGFTFYSLKGKKVPEVLSRRYRDFDALRKKWWKDGLVFIFLNYLIRKK
jgi:hypothetical protein